MAIPNPEQELSRLRGVLRSGVPRLVLLLGPAELFRDEALAAVRAALPPERELRTVSGERETDGRELLDLRGGTLFGDGCTVIVRRGEGWLKQHGASVSKLVPKIAPGCALVVEAVKLDRRTKAGKALAAAAEVFEFRALYTEPYDRTRSPLEAEVVGWIRARAKAAGVMLTPEAALLLVGTVGTDLAECLAEVHRLVSRFGQGKSALTPAELVPELPCSFQSTPFELAEALLDGDQRRALRSLEAMFGRGVRGRDGTMVDAGGVFPFISSWLFQALSKAHEGRALLDRGVPLRDIPGRMGVRAFVPRYQQQVARNPQARLRRGLALLHEAQRKLRTTGEEPAWLLRELVRRYFAGIEGEVA